LIGREIAREAWQAPRGARFTALPDVLACADQIHDVELVPGLALGRAVPGGLHLLQDFLSAARRRCDPPDQPAVT